MVRGGKSFILLCLSLILALACDNDIKDRVDGILVEVCTGNLGLRLEGSECLAESLISLGSRGIGCEPCVSDMRSKKVNVGFSPFFSPDGTSETVFNFQDLTFFVETQDCNTINLLIEGHDGLVLVGILDEIESAAPDDLGFIIQLEGENSEGIFCGACWVGPAPRGCGN